MITTEDPSTSSFENLDESILTNIKDFAISTFQSFKKFVSSIKNLLSNLMVMKGPRMFLNLLKTVLGDIPFISPLYKKYLKDNSLDDRVIRIQDVNTFADWLMIYYKLVNFIGKSIFNMITIVSYVNPANLYGTLFEDENKFIDKIKEKENLTIYKYAHDRMADAGIEESYIAMFLSMYAILSPFYFVCTMLESSKTDLRDPAQYESPLGYVAKDKKTGFNNFEKKILKDCSDLIEKYNDTENELDKKFVLSVHILRKTLLAMIMLFGIYKLIDFIPSWKITNTFLMILQLLVLAYISIIFIFNLMYSALVNEESKRKELSKTKTLNN